MLARLGRCPGSIDAATTALEYGNAGQDRPDRRLEENVMDEHHRLLPRIVVVVAIKVKIAVIIRRR
jgi:hypothetical protein